jgi:hypothetical protein
MIHQTHHIMPGDCDLCGHWDGALIDGLCASCRARHAQPAPESQPATPPEPAEEARFYGRLARLGVPVDMPSPLRGASYINDYLAAYRADEEVSA